ncbi:hypothetical protein R5R35_003360 [Gryllus longicercus]|uniref:Uncharacterized protein n=1 Tax=Gryllus longicercus TaxID=2509291 RepID=A0AAN9VZZ9_9ORTH
MDYSETKHFRSRKSSKPPSTERSIRESALQRVFVTATNILIGAGTACYVENILWNIETLPGFPYNYEYLYCGYYSLNVLSCLATSKYLQYRSNNQQSTNSGDSDSDDEYVHFSFEWIKRNKEIIYVEEQKSNIITVSGTFLISMTLLIVPFLSSAWMLLPLAFLKGATDAFLEIVVPQGCWFTLVFGYGIGCFLGSTIASIFGMTGLFYSASCVMFVCSLSWLCYR